MGKSIVALAANETLDGLLARLDGVRRVGCGWQALCPVHPDTQPSLSIRPGDRVDVICHCHGCGAGLPQVLAAVADRQPDRPVPTGPTADGTAPQRAEWMFRDADAVHRYQPVAGRPGEEWAVIRRPGKQFRKVRRDGRGHWWSGWNVTRAERPLFAPAGLTGERVWLAEGESDVVALVAAGQVAVTCADGAGGWHADYAHRFVNAGQVIVVADRDQRGRTAAASRAGDIATATGRTVLIVEATVGKDARAHLDGGRPVDELAANVTGRARPARRTADMVVDQAAAMLDRDPLDGAAGRYVAEILDRARRGTVVGRSVTFTAAAPSIAIAAGVSSGHARRIRVSLARDLARRGILLDVERGHIDRGQTVVTRWTLQVRAGAQSGHHARLRNPKRSQEREAKGRQVLDSEGKGAGNGHLRPLVAALDEQGRITRQDAIRAVRLSGRQTDRLLRRIAAAGYASQVSRGVWQVDRAVLTGLAARCGTTGRHDARKAAQRLLEDQTQERTARLRSCARTRSPRLAVVEPDLVDEQPDDEPTFADLAAVALTYDGVRLLPRNRSRNRRARTCPLHRPCGELPPSGRR